MGQIKFITSIILIGLFVIALITFAINFGYDNDTSINLANDSDFVSIRNSIEGNVSTTFYSDVNISSDAMYESTISTQTEATEGGTSFKVGPATALVVVKDVVKAGFTKIFGSDSGFGILLTALGAILGYISIMYIYKAWAGRNPD